jgi:mannose-6-phosphate isomerase
MNRIEGRIQHYSWGGKTFLPDLLNIDEPVELPYAEYWLGVHPNGVSSVVLSENATTGLQTFIQSDKKKHLGQHVLAEFNALPFLLKVLDVKDMLSIQVHPTQQAAMAGYHRENELGIPLHATNRNYKDQNHKPEIMVALSDFWLLHGFAADIESRLNKYPLLNSFKSDYAEGGIKSLYKKIMEMPQQEIDRLLSIHAAIIIPSFEKGEFNQDSPDYWAAKAFITFDTNNGHFDRGIFSIYLFNILHLKQGEGIFQGAGMPHAYLEGQNIELMSNSDNVLRAGLTNKHVDIPELLSNLEFVPTIPAIIPGSLNNAHTYYPSNVPDFELHSFFLRSGATKEKLFNGPSIMIMLSGKAHFLSHAQFKCEGFNAFYLNPNELVQIKVEEDLLLFVATVPN